MKLTQHFTACALSLSLLAAATPALAASVPAPDADLAAAVRAADRLEGRVSNIWQPFAVDSQGRLWDLEPCRDGQGSPRLLLERVVQTSGTDNGAPAILALDEDGVLWATGSVGQFGLGDGPDASTDVPLKLREGVKSFSSESTGVMMILEDDSLWYLGRLSRGEDGSGQACNVSGPVQTSHVMDDVAMVDCGFWRFAALKNDGSVWVWGADGYAADGKLISLLGDDPQKPTRILEGMISVGMREENGWAIDGQGGLWTWGCIEDGFTGAGGSYDTTDPSTGCRAQVRPVRIIQQDVVSADRGMAVTRDGSCWHWGTNPFYSKANSEVPVPMEASRLIATSSQTIAAADGTLQFLDFDDQPIHTMTDFAPAEPQPQSPAFRDVSPRHWAADSIRQAAEQGWINGLGNGLYGPDGKVTAAQWYAMVTRALCGDAIPGQVPEALWYSGHWYSGSIQAALDRGLDSMLPEALADGEDLSRSLTRREMACIAAAALADHGLRLTPQQESELLARIPDAHTLGAYQSGVLLAYHQGVIGGVDKTGTFSGEGLMTRAQAAAVLCRLMEAMG